jgi:hypothetical protein
VAIGYELTAAMAPPHWLKAFLTTNHGSIVNVLGKTEDQHF